MTSCHCVKCELLLKNLLKTGDYLQSVDYLEQKSHTFYKLNPTQQLFTKLYTKYKSVDNNKQFIEIPETKTIPLEVDCTVFLKQNKNKNISLIERGLTDRQTCNFLGY